MLCPSEFSDCRSLFPLTMSDFVVMVTTRASSVIEETPRPAGRGTGAPGQLISIPRYEVGCQKGQIRYVLESSFQPDWKRFIVSKEPASNNGIKSRF